MSLFSRVLIDSCVLMDAHLSFRDGHQEAVHLLRQLAHEGSACYMPSHAYFEQAVAAIIHFKRDQELLNSNPVQPVNIPNLNLQVIALNDTYANQLLQVLHGRPIPDLKSQDLIYFCIAREQALTLLTEDRKLRNVARRGGLNAYHVDEALALLVKGP